MIGLGVRKILKRSNVRPSLVTAFVLGGVFAERSDGPAKDLGEKIDNVATQ